MKLFANRALFGDTWASNVRLSLLDGIIESVQSEASAENDDLRVDTLLPAMSNLHSHSFQRAVAGMTEFRAKGRESFWTWRDLMYRFLDALTPQHLEAIAGLAFMEMLKSGYAAVGEFHYIHHQQGGVGYDNPAELSGRILKAARETGIGLTHLPVLYSYGDVSQKPLEGGQLRFGNDVDQFRELVEACKALADEMPADTIVGVAPHSLRATSPVDLERIVATFSKGPVHIHIAEQTKEVEAVQAALGGRPVEWLLDNFEVDSRWCLIHATHMTAGETRAMACSGAVAGLCPVTEANLGDGIFNGAEYLQAGGVSGIGTDSNVSISLSEELKMLEYSQRLKNQQRNVLVEMEGSTGTALYLSAVRGGARALERNTGEIATGKIADLVAIDTAGPRMCSLGDDQILDGLIFAANDGVVTDVWSAGRHQVRGGHHVDEEGIIRRYRSAMQSLTQAL